MFKKRKQTVIKTWAEKRLIGVVYDSIVDLLALTTVLVLLPLGFFSFHCLDHYLLELQYMLRGRKTIVMMSMTSAMAINSTEKTGSPS